MMGKQEFLFLSEKKFVPNCISKGKYRNERKTIYS